MLKIDMPSQTNCGSESENKESYSTINSIRFWIKHLLIL